MDVSSVHWPGSNWNGPPPIMSSIGLNVPGDRNSRVVPRASPAAKPSRQPRNRSRVLISGISRLLRCTDRPSRARRHAVAGFRASAVGEQPSPCLATTPRSGPALPPPFSPCRTSQQPTTMPVRPTPPQQCRYTTLPSPKGVIHGVEDPCHLLPRARDVPISDRMPRVHYRRAQVKRFLFRESGV